VMRSLRIGSNTSAGESLARGSSRSTDEDAPDKLLESVRGTAPLAEVRRRDRLHHTISYDDRSYEACDPDGRQPDSVRWKESSLNSRCRVAAANPSPVPHADGDPRRCIPYGRAAKHDWREDVRHLHASAESRLPFGQTGLVWGVLFFCAVVALGLAARFYA